MATGVVIAGARATLSRASALIKEAMLRSPALVGNVGRRIGVTGSKATVNGIATAVRNNKTLTVLALYEIGSEGHAFLREMAEQDSEIQSIIEMYGMLDDEVSETTSVNDIVNFKDEFEVIRTAIAITGSFERFLALRRALALSNETISLYRELRDMSKSL